MKWVIISSIIRAIISIVIVYYAYFETGWASTILFSILVVSVWIDDLKAQIKRLYDQENT